MGLCFWNVHKHRRYEARTMRYEAWEEGGPAAAYICNVGAGYMIRHPQPRICPRQHYRPTGRDTAAPML